MEENKKNKNTYEIIEQLEKEGKVLSGINDCIFKSLFQSEECKPVLAHIIGEVLNLSKDYVLSSLSFKPTELAKEKYYEHGKITDLIVEITGRVINLEMNSEMQREIKNNGKLIKNNGYHHNMAGTSVLMAENYEDAKEIIQINFDCINKFDDRLIITFKLMDEKGKYVLDEKFTNYHINMEKVRKIDYNKKEISKFEKILLILQEESKEKIRKISKGDKELEKMVKKIEEMSYDPKVIGLYDKERMDKLVHDIDVHAAHEKGSKQKQIDIAKKMISKKMDIDMISDITDLSKEEIQNLK